MSTTEPVRIISLINTALGLTIGLMAFLFEWTPELTGIVVGVFSAWVGVAGELMRSKVTPLPPAIPPPV